MHLPNRDFFPLIAFFVFVIVLMMITCANAVTDTELCVQKCLDAEVVTPPTTSVFPHKITFENSADQANGNAAILFRTIPDGTVKTVFVNGEAARLGKPYKGASVFLLSKPGDQYSRPLKFAITTSDGKVWTAISETISTGTTTTPAGYSKQATYKAYGKRNGGRWAWRIPRKGPEFGSNIKVVFSNGHTVIVRDTSHNYREGDGFVFKPGIGPNGEGDDNTGTAHGGVYLHAPYGDSSKTVTVHYNGK